jgi:hypothetical protein
MTWLSWICFLALQYHVTQVCPYFSLPKTPQKSLIRSRSGMEWRWGHGANAYVHDWCMEWIRSPTRLSKSRGRSGANPVWVPKVEAQSNTSSSPVRSPGEALTKNDAPVAYGVRFGRSLYGWNENFIELIPMAPFSGPNSFGVYGNHRNKLTSRIWQAAASPVCRAFSPSCGRPHPWPPQP